MCLTPLIAVITAAIFLGERPRPLQAVGAAFILAGIVLTRQPAASTERDTLAPEG
jgi:drug/metabolite transporter (DMT)-like permease